MTITPYLLESYLKCRTKCWLRPVGEQTAGPAGIHKAQAQNESYRINGLQRLLLGEDECIQSPSADDLKTGTWRLATNVRVQTQHLESLLHAVERLPSERRGNPAKLIPIRFAPTNKLS